MAARDGFDRRRALAALALAPALARAQPAPARRRLALVGFEGMFDGPQGLDQVARILGQRGLVEGRQIEVLRLVVPAPSEQESRRGLDYLVPTLERLVPPQKPDAIVVLGSILAKGMHLATKTIPIVAALSDPVDLGVAQSLARPGTNVTGLANGTAETAVKSFELLKQLVPTLRRLAIFHDARPVATKFAGLYERAARSVSVEPVMVSGFEAAELVKALRAMPPRAVQAGLMAWSPPEGAEAFYAEAAARRLPLMGIHESEVEKGCLVAYHASDPEPQRRLAEVAELVLRGADPATTPFRFPQAFRLSLNRRTANAMGFAIPPDVLLRADRVIE